MRKKIEDDYKGGLGGGGLYLPKTFHQGLYVKHLQDPRVPLVFGVGPAGSGKTLFACSAAMEQYKQGLVDKIVLTRPMVSVEEDLGFLPGTVIHKMEPWTRPLFDIFYEYCSKKEVELMLKNGDIEISPLAYMRGRTFKRSFIIADEMQNSSPNQMLMLLTRVGEDSKMVVTGDLKQSDLPLEKNGLHDFVLKWKSYPRVNQSIELVEFNHTDVCRSDIVSLVLDVYNKTNEGNVSLKKNTSVPLFNTTYFGSGSGSNSTRVRKVTIEKNDSDAALIPIWDESRVNLQFFRKG
jgi:phosphate starvation-inducible PhoH-like protein